MAKIIGRHKEIKELENAYSSRRPEFIAVYGRRRVGKTYLIRELFKERMTFAHTGLPPQIAASSGAMKLQLSNFTSSLSKYGSNEETELPRDWFKAFDALERLLDTRRNGERQIVFIDELPWMDTPRSDFLAAFSNFWNSYCSWHEDIMLIVCGSVTSWMTSNLLDNYGGLYGRLTHAFRLLPFSLGESEEFLKSRGVEYSRYDELQCYMITGGIPYYLEQFARGKSLPQSVDDIFFRKDAPLKDEYSRLFNSLFIKPDDYISIIRMLSKKHYGMTRKEIVSNWKKADGKGLTKILKVLEENGFIATFKSYNGKSSQQNFRVIDSFCLFYLNFLDGDHKNSENFWEANFLSPSLNAWRGLMFENICFQHIPQIKKAIGISAVHTDISVWQTRGDNGGAQIDMLVSRADHIINLCEIKYSLKPFCITSEYEAKLRNKIALFLETLPPTQTIHLTFISAMGLQENEHSSLVQCIIDANALFD